MSHPVAIPQAYSVEVVAEGEEWVSMTAPGSAETQAAVSEADLVREAQAGSADAFERLYRKHGRRVYAVCLRMVSDPDRAEELMQDAFVRAWSAIGSFQHRSAFGTWLHRLAVNVVLSDVRAEKRRSSRELLPGELDEFEREVGGAMPETRVDLERAIAALPSGAKEVLILHDIEGYRYREIAKLIGGGGDG